MTALQLALEQYRPSSQNDPEPFFLKLTLSPWNKIFSTFLDQKAGHPVHISLSFRLVLSQFNPVNGSIFYLRDNHFNIILHLRLGQPVGLAP